MPDSSDATLASYIARFKVATDLASDFVRGDATIDVNGEGGAYPSLAKLAAQAKTKIDLLQSIQIHNGSTDDMVFGQPIYAVQETSCALANASVIAKKNVIGLVTNDIIISQSGIGLAQYAGLLTGTLEQWDAVTGMVGGLLPNRDYFLDVTSGKMTPFPPSEIGQFFCPLGRSISSTVFSIHIERPVAL